MEILIIFLLMILNGLFAMSEMAVIFSRKTRLQHWAREGNTGAQTALELAENPNRFLSTIQVGITLIGILAGAFGGTTVARSLDAYLKGIPFLKGYSEALSLGVVVLALTYLSIVIGELVPKRLALNNAERIASVMAVPLRWVSKVTHPVVQVLTISSEWILKLLGSSTLPRTVHHRRGNQNPDRSGHPGRRFCRSGKRYCQKCLSVGRSGSRGSDDPPLRDRLAGSERPC